MRSLFTPLLPDDYLELINPLWSTRELRGRIERISRENDNAVTILIKPGFEWEGHKPGQYLRVGVVVDGVHHWRAYSLTSDPDRPDGWISITPKTVDEGTVSPFFNQNARPGDIVRLGGVEGTFVLPDPAPEKLLFISAGSGITPIMSMLRHIHAAGEIRDVHHIHSARRDDGVIFGDTLEKIDSENEGFRLHRQTTVGRRAHRPQGPRRLVPGLARARDVPLGPRRDDRRVRRLFRVGFRRRPREAPPRALPAEGRRSEEGKGGTVTFLKSDCTTECDGSQPILEAGEEAGLELEHGCRMGICHTCVGKLTSGEIRDMRTGEITKADGQTVRICITTAEGDVELEL